VRVTEQYRAQKRYQHRNFKMQEKQRFDFWAVLEELKADGSLEQFDAAAHVMAFSLSEAKQIAIQKLQSRHPSAAIVKIDP
jgi:hypothetical protein